MKRPKMVILCVCGIVAATGLVSWIWIRPATMHFQRMAFSVVAGKPLQYNLQGYYWQLGKEKIDAGQAIANGQGVTFRQRAVLRLHPARKGKSNIFFSFSCKAFLPEGIRIAIVHRSQGREHVLQLFKVTAKKNDYFSSIVSFARDDTILVRAEGWGALILGDAVIADIAPPKNRNYVFVIAPDTFRGDRLGKRSRKVLVTPNLEAFSRDAVVFENAVAPSAWTLPSFASIFSGLYEFRHKVTRRHALSPEQPHLLANLAPGYVTIQFNDDAWLSPKNGFARNHDCFLNSSQATDVYADRCLFANAQRFLEANPLPALFMFLHTYKLHMPYEPGAEFLAAINPTPQFRRKGSFINSAQFNAHVPEMERLAMEELYDTEVLQFDHFFGEFITYLKVTGIYDQSLIVLISDHGEEFGEHGGWFHGHSLYREVFQVPFIVKFPQGLYAGRHVQEFVSMCDALPTVLDYLKLKVPSEIDGISLLPLLKGSRTRRGTIFSSTAVSLFNEFLPPRFAMFFDHYQLIFNFPLTPRAKLVYRKFGQPPTRPKIELFDMRADPGERHDISAQQKKLLDSLWPEIILVLKEIRGARKTGVISDTLSEAEKNTLRSLGYL